MSNLLNAADKLKSSSNVGSSSIVSDSDDFLLKLKEEVMDRFTIDLQRLTSEVEFLRRTTHQEEDTVLRTLDDVRSREDERLDEARRAVKDYEQIVSRFKNDISREVQQYHTNIVSDVESKLRNAMESEELKEQREE